MNMQWRILDGMIEGGTPVVLFTINAFECGHMVGAPFYKGLDQPLFTAHCVNAWVYFYSSIMIFADFCHIVNRNKLYMVPAV